MNEEAKKEESLLNDTSKFNEDLENEDGAQNEQDNRSFDCLNDDIFNIMPDERSSINASARMKVEKDSKV